MSHQYPSLAFFHGKVVVMSYWDSSKKSSCPNKTTTVQDTNCPLASSFWYLNFREPYAPTEIRSCQKITLEQEVLLVLMRLRLGLFVEDLAFRFCV